MGCFEEGEEKKTIYQERARELNRLIDTLSLEEKVEKSLGIIKQALKECSQPVISSSFGKDSVVLLHLVHKVNNTVPVVFINTGVQFRETLEFKDYLADLWDLNVYEVKGERSFWDVVGVHGYPKESRNSKKGDKRAPACCKILKEEPMKKFIKSYGCDLNFVGLLGDEGRQRRWVYIYKGSAFYDYLEGGYKKCVPLIWWTQGNVWEYIKLNEIPVNPAYEKYKVPRTGCVPCTGHKGWEEQVAKSNMKLYQKVQSDLGQYLIEEFGVSV